MAEDEHTAGHDVHFLSRLSRVCEKETDLALRLYRSPTLVSDLVEERALPDGAPRVALAIEPGPACTPPQVG